MDALNKFYDYYAEGDRLFSSKASSIEYFTNMFYFQKYLLSNSDILELGAGHGTYSINLALEGHNVVSTDIVHRSVEMITKTAEAKKLSNIQALLVDATDLQIFPNNKFDMVLCLGPYYHLRDFNQRKQCILECKRVVKPNGLVAIAYINRNFALAYYNKKGTYFSKDEYIDLQNQNYTNTGFNDKFLNISYFTNPENIESEVIECGLNIVEHIASDGLYSLLKSNIESMQEDEFKALLNYHIQTSSLFSSLGASSHNLILAKR